MNIYTPAYNEMYLLGFYYRFYKQRFPSATFTILDNNSSDPTAIVALSLGMNVFKLNTNDTYDEYTLMQARYSCYKRENDFTLVCDADEWIDITQDELMQEKECGTTIIRTQGYQMCNVDDYLDLLDIKHGYKDDDYSKNLLFDAGKIEDMRWVAGCHRSRPIGNVVYSEKVYNLYHMKYWNKQYLIDRYTHVNKRRSEHSRKNSHGIHYDKTPEQIATEYDNAMAKATIIR
jgi:hypothetical protein